MGHVSYYVIEALQDAIKKWVVDCWITPKLKVGDKMEIEYKKEKYEGEIKEIRKLVAQYMFYVPAVMDKNTIGTYKDFEDIEIDFFKKND